MTGTVGSDIERRKRMMRRLLAGGRGFAEAYGLRVTNNPGSLFQVLYLAVLLRRTGDVGRATATARGLRDRGWDTPARLARSLAEDRAALLREYGWRGGAAMELSVLLGDLAQALVRRYRGDLRRVRVAARYRPDRERALLTALPAVDDGVVELFLREAQALWPESGPVADRRALAAARKLGLGRNLRDLVALAGSRESERFAWFVGALARTDAENAYGPLRAGALG
ncbi:hypothetical protein [Plantactinospora sp. KBS50]|uniref:hypothetical protein n=1 Tax=Plantactinospora sp. KBS50 TaxID=2024580 RepID=UPI000BAADB54|nr:hypothetical protein [Plantactinospora sp. KBS50]ASW54986.1 hypothetical protein CIK06_13485 [Plantactinospora sp. KBS50]